MHYRIHHPIVDAHQVVSPLHVAIATIAPTFTPTITYDPVVNTHVVAPAHQRDHMITLDVVWEQVSHNQITVIVSKGVMHRVDDSGHRTASFDLAHHLRVRCIEAHSLVTVDVIPLGA